jgi:N-acetyl sugar amidotransferase
MRWCDKCILPDTRPNLTIGVDGICNACTSHGTKQEINWAAREKAFCKVVARVKEATHCYDCLIPVSGGKDSTWQVIKCLEYGLSPLAVTWKPPARTGIGRQNLENLVSLGVDHIDYQVNPKVEARFMVKAFERFGSTAIPMHMAIFNIPLTIALRFRIPLVVWGENSAIEYGCADEAHTGFKMDNEWLKNYGVTHGTTATDWIDKDLNEKELTAYFGPHLEDLEAADMWTVFLGYYFEWDPEMSATVAKAHGFEADDAGPRTGYYDYADIDDDFISIHHWMKWYKFGFDRLFDNLSLEIRNNRLTRDEAIEIVCQSGDNVPTEDIAKLCSFTGISTERFFQIAVQFRNTDIWKQRQDGIWYIPDFLIPDWKWQ